MTPRTLSELLPWLRAWAKRPVRVWWIFDVDTLMWRLLV